MGFKTIAVTLLIFSVFNPLWVMAQQEVDFVERSSVQLSYNFGQIKEGEKVIHIFEILNKSQSPWQIKNILTSCGCISARVIKDGKAASTTVAPRKVLKIEVEIDSATHKGKFEQFVYVKISQVDKLKILKLVMQGEVIENYR